MYNITIFNAEKTKDLKFPYSPYNDNTFIFNTYSTENIEQLWVTMVSNWILNIPLSELKEPTRTFRRKENLDKYYSDTINYFVLDLDKVYSEDAVDYIINYFSEYKCIIGKSTSYNTEKEGKKVYNMKGIVFINDTTIQDAKTCIRNLKFDLKDYCEVDEAVSRKVSLNAPIGRNEILLKNIDKPIIQCTTKQKTQQIEDGYIEVTSDKIKIDLDNITGDTIEEYCINIFKNMGFESVKYNDNNSISFKHPSETKSTGGYFWFESAPYTMHHPNSVKTINIFDAVRKTDRGKELMKIEIDYDDAFLKFDTNTKVVNVNEKYLTVEGKEDILNNFISEKNGLLSIKSPMGTGKSTIIQYLIERAHDEDMSVLIITNRRSVASDFSRKYSMKLYNKDNYELGDSLIVQFDSLWRYDIKNFDMVVMDEFISLMMHSRNNLSNSSLNIGKFFASFHKKLVIADAFLTGYENFLLSSKKSNIVQLNNNYRDSTTLFIYEDKNYFVLNLIKQAREKKITVSATSTVFLNSLKKVLEKYNLKVILLDGSTPDSTRELIYDLFEQDEHDKWDVFLYSPTLTVGVSNLNNVYEHYHYDSSKSTDVISSIQMIKRTRKAKNIHMFISEGQRFMPITYNSVRDSYMGNIANNIDTNYMFDIDDYGEPKLSTIGVNCVKIDTFKNIMEFNHREGMLWMMKYHFAYKPRIISEKYSENILSHYSKKLKDEKEYKLSSSINDFLSLNEIQRTDILLDTDNTDQHQKLLKILIEIDEHIKPETPNNIRVDIINIALKNKQFIKQCNYYKMAYDYTLGFINDNDIKIKISKAVINSSPDLVFYNQLLKFGQNRFESSYKSKPKEKLLSYILDNIGYKMGKVGEVNSNKDVSNMSLSEKKEYLEMSKRVYRINPDIKQYYGFIKE